MTDGNIDTTTGAAPDHSDLPEVPEAAAGGGGTATVTKDDVTEAMKDVVDPELGINVVDLARSTA
jgi:hypothetical protein